MNKNILFSTLFALMLIFATSCGDGGKDTIVGKWKVVEAKGTASSMAIGTEYNFNKDGSAATKAMSIEVKYTYKTENNILIMNYNGGDDIVLHFNYSLKGSKLTLENTSDKSQKFVLERQ